MNSSMERPSTFREKGAEGKPLKKPLAKASVTCSAPAFACPEPTARLPTGQRVPLCTQSVYFPTAISSLPSTQACVALTQANRTPGGFV